VAIHLIRLFRPDPLFGLFLRRSSGGSLVAELGLDAGWLEELSLLLLLHPIAPNSNVRTRTDLIVFSRPEVCIVKLKASLGTPTRNRRSFSYFERQPSSYFLNFTDSFSVWPSGGTGSGTLKTAGEGSP
jgi:hypothetical protein